VEDCLALSLVICGQLLFASSEIGELSSALHQDELGGLCATRTPGADFRVLTFVVSMKRNVAYLTTKGQSESTQALGNFQQGAWIARSEVN